MENIDIDLVGSFIREVAAQEIMPRFRKLETSDVEQKLDKTSVTIADKEAERALIKRLKDYLPNSVVVGEESFEIDPGIINHFGGEDFVWVIDPIDGTSNFINGTPEFASMIALVRRRQTIASWIYDPNSGDMLASEASSGVWMGGKRMHLAGRDPAVRTGIIGSRLKRILGNPLVASVLQKLPVLETGSAAAFDYGRLFAAEDGSSFASSKAKRVAYLLYRQSKPWDHVPGLFMLKEEKGYAADLLGEPYNMGANEGLLVAPSQALWQAFHQGLQPAISALKLD